MTMMIYKDEKSLVWQPAYCKYCHHNNEHLYHLQQIKKRNIRTKSKNLLYALSTAFNEFTIH